MKALTGILFAAVFLTGCTTTQWVHSNKSQETFYQEKLACEELANNLAWQRYPQPAVVMIQNNNTSGSSGESGDPNEYNRNIYQELSLDECLQSKGWKQEIVK